MLTYWSEVNHIELWSDEGGKHFKCIGTLSFLSTIYNIEIVYNFFDSYHGQRACDAAASHAKRRINTTVRNAPQTVRTANTLATIVVSLHHHYAEPLEVLDHSLKDTFKTFSGITSYYKFKFTGTTILAYTLSKDTEAAKEYPVSNSIFNLLDAITLQRND